ncbi:MAG: YheC/YheD family protein, partial [Candidatus Omnitrophota bacterium]
MIKKNKDITIVAIGDKPDYDSFLKFDKEKEVFIKKGFEYISLSYKRFSDGCVPKIKTDKVFVFLFFPFIHWNKFIEHRNYRGVYGNMTFHRKFTRFWEKIERRAKKVFNGKEVFFVNKPLICGMYRDKSRVHKEFLSSGVREPQRYNISSVESVEKILDKGQDLFIKPRFGSMGKGITFLSKLDWRTNFMFKNNKIVSRKSDSNWEFRNITGNKKFLSQLLKKDILIEDAINSLSVKGMKVDLRIYTFFKKVVYVYPRRNTFENTITNISQGGVGD